MRSLIKCAGILVCLFLSAACAKEQINSVEEPSHAQEWDASKYLLGFDASMEDMTKAEIDFSSGSVTWTNGDKVLVVAGTTSAEYAWDGSAFKPQNTPVEFGSDPAYAYFPADCFTVSGGEVSFTMPQALAADPGKKLPMAGLPRQRRNPYQGKSGEQLPFPFRNGNCHMGRNHLRSSAPAGCLDGKGRGE